MKLSDVVYRRIENEETPVGLTYTGPECEPFTVWAEDTDTALKLLEEQLYYTREWGYDN